MTDDEAIKIVDNAIKSEFFKRCNIDYKLAEALGIVVGLAESKKDDVWISVEERLPENDEYVLVYDNSDMFVAWFSKEWGWCSFDGNLDEYIPIIAWRPLPKAPESEDK